MIRYRNWILSAVVALVLLVAPSGEAAAQEENCYIDDDSGQLICVISAPAIDPVSQPIVPGSPLVWETEPAIGPCPGRSVIDPVTGVETVQNGTYTWIRVRNTITGEIVSERAECLYPGEPAPTPPPPPPTPAEFAFAAEDILLPTTELSPKQEFDGVTGIDTWFWCDQPDPVTVPPITVRGWTAQATVSVTNVTWNVTSDVADSFTLTSDDCGAEPAIGSDGSVAAEIWTPRTKGTYNIEILSEWTGTWTLSYGAINTGPQALGPVEIDGDDVQYRVIEVIALGTD